MPTYRIGIGSEFNLKDRKVGIGSESPIGDLDITGIIKSANLYTSGISTLITYSGFSASNKDRDSITLGYNDRQIYTMSVTNNGTDHYTFSNAADRKGVVTGGDPDITINVGDTLKITNTVGATHPLWINHTQGTGNGNGVSDVIGNGDARNNAVVTWIPTESGVYYYNCQHHANMTGRITVQAVSFDRNYSTELDIVVGVGETLTLLSDTTLNVGSISDVKVGNTFRMPVGDRPEVPVEGTVRFNRDLNTLEFYNGVEWRQFTVSGARGRCLAMGGSYASSPATTIVHSIELSTLGNSIGFGNLEQEISQSGGGGNSIRAMTFGGSSPGGNRDYIQYRAIASSGTFEDFGNLSSQRQTVAAVSTSTRAVATAGATSGDTVQNILEFVEIATTGDAVDFGDLITRRRASGALGSPVRGVVVAGCTPTIFGNIEFFSPQSFGSAADWGEMDVSRSPYAFSNSVRGIIAGGIHSFSPNTRRNGIDYLIIASAGTNVSDFGDLTLKRDAGGANGHSCNQTRGLICGGYANPGNADINTIDYITIETAGNAQDFGDMSVSSWGYIANTTDSHGGLGGY